MEFCEICDNLLYLRAEDDNALIKYCKHCTFSKRESAESGKKVVRVTQNLYSEDDLLYLQYQNKYLRFDPTLPRVRDPLIRCPDNDCEGSNPEKSQVLYIKYHPIHMKYLYCCDFCGKIWRAKNDST
jgi:DNA-directed RNA polymerase subunit M/transcription elongation factor TFIIS